MKKFWLMLIALILCLSLLTGCVELKDNDDDEDDDEREEEKLEENEDGTEEPGTDKSVVADSLDKIDDILDSILGSNSEDKGTSATQNSGANNEQENAGADGDNEDAVIGDSTVVDDEAVKDEDYDAAVDNDASVDNGGDSASNSGSVMQYLDLIKNIAFGADFNLSGTVDGSEGSISADVVLKDGKGSLGFVSSGDGYETYSQDMYIEITDCGFDIYSKYGDEWYKESVDIGDYINSEMMSGVKDILSMIEIPSLTEKDLAEKDGKLFVSNDYLVKIVMANTDILEVITGERLDSDDLADLEEELKEFLEESKLQIYFGTGSKGITLFGASIDYEDIKGSAEIVLTSDSSALKSITVQINHDYSEGEIKYTPTSVFKLETILNTDKKVVGATLDMDLYMETAGYGDAYDNYYDDENYESYSKTYTSIYSKISADVTVNLANINKTNADIIKVDIKSATDKVIKTETSSTGVTVTEGDKKDYNDEEISITATLKSVKNGKITLDFDMEADHVNISADGELNYSIKDKKFTFDGKFSTTGVDLEFDGNLNFGSVKAPVLPKVA